ncbi:unnamed protein product [Linum tenue]|uniref:Uncharacterized protein n=1 Tax=Linum tenue TaxID=586396 RepID=A0AAV0MNK9_9ROSI|nr:unnamed protein product [Linum tenue]
MCLGAFITVQLLFLSLEVGGIRGENFIVAHFGRKKRWIANTLCGWISIVLVEKRILFKHFRQRTMI